MAGFMSDLQGGVLRPSPSSFSFLDIDPTSAFHHIPNNTNNSETNFFPFPQEGSLQPQEVSGGVVVPGGAMNQKNYAGSNNHDGDDCNNDRKRRKKPMEFSQGSCSAATKSSVPAKRRKQGSGGGGGGGGGRGKKIIKGDEQGEGERGRKEVVHVRARRGQATDSHSLAERVRRGKINERLRCLQDIVPGCYKTMGLAVMLDEIISYVQSLQHQVEFLSMKLTAASSFYDFNSESDLIDAMQRAKAYEAKELEKLLMSGKFEGNSPTTTTTTTTTSNPISTFLPFDHIL